MGRDVQSLDGHSPEQHVCVLSHDLPEDEVHPKKILFYRSCNAIISVVSEFHF